MCIVSVCLYLSVKDRAILYLYFKNQYSLYSRFLQAYRWGRTYWKHFWILTFYFSNFIINIDGFFFNIDNVKEKTFTFMHLTKTFVSLPISGTHTQSPRAN